MLEVGNECLLSSIALPYWNKNADWDVWIRMVLDDDEFDVEVSVNCENAHSFMQKIEIKPKELLENIGATKLSEEPDEQMQADTEEKTENAQ